MEENITQREPRSDSADHQGIVVYHHLFPPFVALEARHTAELSTA